MMTFVERLKNAMRYRGKTQTDIAVNCGIDKGNLSHYLKGDCMPKQATIMKIANYLEVSPSYLLGLDSNMLFNTNNVIVNLGKDKTNREMMIDEITANLTWLDDDTLKTINQMVKALRKK